MDPALYAEAHRRTREFFEGHALDEKLRYRARRQGSVNQGYFPMRETTVIHPDLVEGWVFCRRAFDLGREPGLGRGGVLALRGLGTLFPPGGAGP